MTSDTEWRLEKKIPVGALIAIGIQTAAFAYFMGGLSERVSILERASQSRDSDIAKMARMESQISEIFRAVKRIEDDLKRVRK